MNFNFQQLKELDRVFESLCVLRRWTSFEADYKYNEISKQSLNCIAAYMLASTCEHEGISIKWDRFPKIAMYRAFQKTYVCYDTPWHKMQEICELGNIPKDTINEVTKIFITEKTDSALADFLEESIGKAGSWTFEFQIYRAATKIATTVELFEISNKMQPEDFATKLIELRDSLNEYVKIPGVLEMLNFKGNLFKLLREISRLRNQSRWASHLAPVQCTVLGHLFDTAVFAYAISLEVKPGDTELATKRFFQGIFHDVPETWTTDIPSPIKDKIAGFRRATERYERKMLEEHLYAKLPEFLKESLHLVLDVYSEEDHKVLKGGDYLSADSECYRQYRAGSRDDYYIEALARRIPKIESGDVALPPVCGELYKYIVKYAESTQKN